ncbi:methyltransferase domain-containing protein [Caenimonas koreensis DSM 17982]|uniref:Protein-L-isoaspartate O-methyltransferase n=1 Tax=Caenimonas koreensis DSM 17982 TaxID=1121255 RepID=A0A844AVP9_9BURK|nr:protein-L-isoaspartate O-methyltransferase [Caenimonas koreensis]MRD46458.1 methyltransferase domain-containing protein [Caenimonas koreensis DSM 17982]
MTAPANLEHARFNMIEQQIRPWDVLDLDILSLLGTLHREDFVPAAHKALAFVDMQIPLLGSGDEAMQSGWCMLEPKVEARILQDLHVKRTDKVLEVGTGSGYMAALLAARAQRVISMEINPDLVALARANLENAGITNAQVRQADGSQGLASEGAFDVIVLSGSVAEVPHNLLAQLKLGGRLAAIVGSEPMMRATFITRESESTYTTTQPWDTVAPRLAHFPEPSRFSF